MGEHSAIFSFALYEAGPRVLEILGVPVKKHKTRSLKPMLPYSLDLQYLFIVFKQEDGTQWREIGKC